MKVRQALAATLVLAVCGCGMRMPPRPSPVVIADAQPRSVLLRVAGAPVTHRCGRICPDCGGVVRARPDQPPALIVVDGRVLPVAPGAPVPIDPARIQSIELLKGSEAVLRYGPAAMHGVVLITLKH
ncbi:MAG TPA: hypothetical protein VF092_30695 [Longimicrobium sp.]